MSIICLGDKLDLQRTLPLEEANQDSSTAVLFPLLVVLLRVVMGSACAGNKAKQTYSYPTWSRC